MSCPGDRSGFAARVTIADMVRDGAKRLDAAGLATPRLDAEVLLRHVLGIDRAKLFLILPDIASPSAVDAFDALLQRRLAGEPVAYIVGTREFMGLPFAVEPDVLIPRPETELLVEWALGWLGTRSSATVVDAGTGSGAIAISLAALAPPECSLTIIGTDLSSAALTIALSSASLNNVAGRGRVSFVQASLLEPIRGGIDLVLANLPYLTSEQIAENPDLDAEPALALDGGLDGLDLVRHLIGDLPRVLAPEGAVALELDPSQTDEVEGLMRSALPGKDVRTLRDLTGRTRHVIAT